MAFPTRTDQRIFLKTPLNIANVDPHHQPVPFNLKLEEKPVSTGEPWLNSLQFRETSIDFLSLANQVKKGQ